MNDTRGIGRAYPWTTIYIYIHSSTALTLPHLGLLLFNVAVMLSVQLARLVEHRVCVSVRRALRAVFIRALISAVTLRADSTSDLAGARRLLMSVSVAVVARTTVIPDNER